MRYRLNSFLLIGSIALLASTGCQKAPSTTPATASKSAQTPLENEAPQAEAAASQTVILDPSAKNEAGQIVLLGETLEKIDSQPSDLGSPNVASKVAAADGTLVEAQKPPNSTPAEPASEPSSGAQPAASVADSRPPQLPSAANVTTEEERNQKIAEDWPQPQVVLFVSGQQHGYLEPCGCTGLDQQKGGLIRRDTLLTSLRDRGWELVPVDVGNQVRRTGRQPELKFRATVEAFKKMEYAAATLGVDDLKLTSVEVVQAAGADAQSQSQFISANVSVLDPSFFPDSKIIEAGGRKIGITAVLGQEHSVDIQSTDVEVSDPVEKLLPVVAKLKQENCDFIVLLAHASMKESAAIAQQVPGINLVVTAGGFGEPTLNPEPIAGSDALMVQVGVKGMYGGIVGLFDDVATPIRYQRIAISSQFKDSVRLLADFAVYQEQLKAAGFSGLGVSPVAHPTGRQFVGSEACADCHSTAFEIWQNSPHHHATESIVNPPNDRGGIQRHFDPECVSCHVTGWNPQEYYPFETGYASLEASEHLLASGCENCHGPGSQHVAAELGEIDADNELLKELREQMILPLARARDKCLECHDLDNSPDFHVEGAFETYWEQVKHYGKD